MTRICAVPSTVLLVLGLLTAACAPAAAPIPPPARAPTSSQPASPPTSAPTPTLQAAPQPKATVIAPTVVPAAPVSTPPNVEKPRYGGVITNAKKLDAAHFDVHQDTTIQIQHVVAPVYSLLVQNDP
ncbi:MAG: hypothetical protein Q8O76_13720, partial [Chloroflexota bacterium]|nr:hypothetical protein [Chloroflexota bacterium]